MSMRLADLVKIVKMAKELTTMLTCSGGAWTPLQVQGSQGRQALGGLDAPLANLSRLQVTIMMVIKILLLILIMTKDATSV